MVDEELVSCEQLFKDLFVLFKDVLDQHVRLVNQATHRLLVTACSETRVVFEDLLCLRIPEKLSKETQLADRLVRSARVEISRLNIFVDDVPLIAAVQHPADLSFEVLARTQPALFHGLNQLLVRARIAQRIGQRVARIAWRHHPPAVLVRLALSELVAIGKLGAQDQ